MEKLKESQYNYIEEKEKNTTKSPIKKGCKNKECFCTGKCNEIIGWREKSIFEK